MGIVHRDIKPSNLLLDLRGQLWVTDFGLAQVTGDAGLTITGELLGTLRYASPEQLLASRGIVDHRSDIYSLGATLYELVTLRPPFEGRDRNALIRQITDDDPVPPGALDTSVPAELETIVLKTLRKEPADRYSTAQDLADDLQRFLDRRPITGPAADARRAAADLVAATPLDRRGHRRGAGSSSRPRPCSASPSSGANRGRRWSSNERQSPHTFASASAPWRPRRDSAWPAAPSTS